MPSTTTYRRGQVIVVNVPFSDATGAKPRPALVVSTEAFGTLSAEDLARGAKPPSACEWGWGPTSSEKR